MPPIRDTKLEVRCRASELAKWKKKADEYGVSLSVYIRALLNGSPPWPRRLRTDRPHGSRE